MKKRYAIILVSLWAALAIFAWFSPAQESSDAERRPLTQMPELSAETVLNGKFMTEFGKYSLDQFPLRDGFRTVKSLFHQYILGQRDNNGIYLAEGHAVKQEYPLKESSLEHAMSRFQYVYDTYLTGSRVFMTIVPDKGEYLAETSGHLTLDHDEMLRAFSEGMPWATQIELRDCLDIADYYRTDTHWRQENLLPAADRICQALGVSGPQEGDLTPKVLDRPFYGVYYGQAALPMEPDSLCFLESPALRECRVYDHESGKTTAVYDESKENGKDLYEVFLSGPRSLLTIENPANPGGKELIVFRDSFGSAIIPLLLTDYAKVTVIDIRYIQPEMLGRFVEFTGQDVLLLYSSSVLNNSNTIK